MPPPGAIEATPPPPPDVAGQMGAAPTMGSIGAQQGGQLNPKGAIVDLWGTIKKALEKLQGMDPKLQTYVGRAVSIIESGVAEASGTGGTPQQAAPYQGPGPEAAKPPEGAAFPG